jgi:hypothetical protein
MNFITTRPEKLNYPTTESSRSQPHQFKQLLECLWLIVLWTSRHSAAQTLDDKKVDTQSTGMVTVEH